MLQKNKDQIIWNLINCAIAAGISFFSAVVAVGEIKGSAIFIAAATGMLVAFTKFRDFWGAEEHEYRDKLLNFL